MVGDASLAVLRHLYNEIAQVGARFARDKRTLCFKKERDLFGFERVLLGKSERFIVSEPLCDYEVRREKFPVEFLRRQLENRPEPVSPVVDEARDLIEPDLLRVAS